MLVGDRERERVAAVLRDHYARGRLSLDDFSVRADRALRARSRAELSRVLVDLPAGPDLGELVRHGRALARSAFRAAVLLVATGAYVFFSFVLLLVFAVVTLASGLSAAAVLAFLVVWLVPTYLLRRLWRRPHDVARVTAKPS